MIGVSEIPSGPSGGKIRGYRSQAGDSSTVAADSRLASCWAFSEVLKRQLNAGVAESAGAYGMAKRMQVPDAKEEKALESDVSRLGYWISYLENKYNLAS